MFYLILKTEALLATLLSDRAPDGVLELGSKV